MAEILDYKGLNELAQQLAEGSRKAIISAGADVSAALLKAYGRGPDRDQNRIICELFPDEEAMGRWDISPYAAAVTVNEAGNQRRYSLGEFIGGIAVACGKEPKPQEIEAVIFHLGKYIGDFEV